MAFWNWKKKEPTDPTITEEELLQMESEATMPAKSAANRSRSVKMTLRLTEEEAAYLKEQAAIAGVSRTDYIMACIQGKPVIVLPGAPELHYELRKEGVNLNQLAASWNAGCFPGQDPLQAAIAGNREATLNLERLVRSWDIICRKALPEEVTQDGDNHD